MTEPTTRQMHLNLFYAPAGYHFGAWRRPGSGIEGIHTLDYNVRMAQQAEAAKLDGFFLADGLGFSDALTKQPAWQHQLEPLTLLAALATATTHIGLIATVSTSFTEPYNLARYLTSIDHLSGGRVGWNVVTSTDHFGANFNASILPHDLRYVQAEEYMQVVYKLFDSNEDGAFVHDRERGVWLDPDKVHEVNHQGEYFRVKTALNIPRGPQGRPVIVQAGSSPVGLEFGARHGEVLFTAQDSYENAANFYTAAKKAVANAGRDPEKVAVMPGFAVLIGDTEAEAEELRRELGNLVDPEVGLSMLSTSLNGLPVWELDLDEEFPPGYLPDPSQVDGMRSRYELFYKLAYEKHYTVREVMWARSASQGHHLAVGTAEQVADELERWFTQGAADGFNLITPYGPETLDAITGKLVPILQERGLFRTEYPGRTLRDTLGLEKPLSQFATAQD